MRMTYRISTVSPVEFINGVLIVDPVREEMKGEKKERVVASTSVP